MHDFLFVAATLVLLTTALGLFGIARRSSTADLIMAVQLLGTSGTAILLLLTVATASPQVGDVAVMLAVLAAFSAVAFSRSASKADAREAAAAHEQRN